MLLRTLRRRGEPELEAPRPDGPADAILDELLPREEIIDRFDATYLDDLPVILREVHGVTDENARDHPLWPKLRELWDLTGLSEDEFSVGGLGGALVEHAGVAPDRHAPLRAGAETQRRFKYVKTRSWRRARGLRVGDGDGTDRRDAVNAIQKEFSMLSGGKYEYDFQDLARPETGDPWSPLMVRLREAGEVSADEPVLTIGPRWVTEIHYFRERLGLKGTIGLDLFSKDAELVKVGDMHDMPFDSDTFGLVYQRNTFDKSYDIRAALSECVRVLRDGGVLITDDCYAYTAGVSEMSRTNIKHNRQLVRALQPHAGEVLHDVETPSNEDWIERVGQLAVRIRK